MFTMKLSVITINRNNADGLQRTLTSVLEQTSREFEYIVIDGASTDGSIDVVRSFSFGIPFKWISEPDGGIYHAMNKGLRLAEGDYCLFLNSGDVLYDPEVIDTFVRADCQADIVAGKEYVPQLGRFFTPPSPGKLTYDYFYDNVLAHQSTFIRRRLLLEYGGYNEEYRIVSDWEFWLKAIVRDNATYEVFPFPVAIFDFSGISNQAQFEDRKEREKESVRRSILPRVCPNIMELRSLRKTKQEFEFLKNGKMGWLVRLMIRLKNNKKGHRQK